MGKSSSSAVFRILACRSFTILALRPPAMAPMKKAAMKAAMKATGKSMSKGAIADALAGENDLKKSVCAKVLNSLASIGTEQVKNSGKFVIPGLVMIKTRKKPATKAGKRMMFGEEKLVKAKPARTIVKGYPVSALKKSI